MSSQPGHQVHVVINHVHVAFEHPEQTGKSIKERAGIPHDHLLCLDQNHQYGEGGCEPKHATLEELAVIDDGERIALTEGQHFFSLAVPAQGTVTVTINRKRYVFADAHQTGRTIKERAGIPLSDVLFLDRPHDDEVIADGHKITLKCGDTFHSAPPANYGKVGLELNPENVGFARFDVLPQPDGWVFLIVHDYELPDAFQPYAVRLLVKLPPLFPEAAPDMFWVSPEVRLANGAAPQGTSMETVLGQPWQRFSWHLLPGAWSPGMSTLRDFMRCVRARAEKRN